MGWSLTTGGYCILRIYIDTLHTYRLSMQRLQRLNLIIHSNRKCINNPIYRWRTLHQRVHWKTGWISNKVYNLLKIATSTYKGLHFLTMTQIRSPRKKCKINAVPEYRKSELGWFTKRTVPYFIIYYLVQIENSLAYLCIYAILPHLTTKTRQMHNAGVEDSHMLLDWHSTDCFVD